VTTPIARIVVYDAELGADIDIIYYVVYNIDIIYYVVYNIYGAEEAVTKESLL